MEFENALALATEQWLGREGVSAVGQGEAGGRPTIDVWVTPGATAELPDELEGHPVIVRSLGGEITAQGEPGDRPPG